MKTLLIRDFLDDSYKPINCSPDTSLQTALQYTDSSHTPIFVIDDSGVFLGMVSPRLVLYKQHKNENTKVSSCLIQPPYFSLDGSIVDIIDTMLSTRIYHLPVLDEHKKLIGAVTLSKIVAYTRKNPELMRILPDLITLRQPIVIAQSEIVEHAYQILRDKNISRLVVVDGSGVVIGIIARHDIQDAFLKPSPRQRFSGKSGNIPSAQAYDGEKIYRGDNPIANFINRNVFTVEASELTRDVLSAFLEKGLNSVIVVDDMKRPIGFISSRDILKALYSYMTEKSHVQITLQDAGNLSMVDKPLIEGHLQKFADKLGKRFSISEIDIHFKRTNDINGKPLLYDVTMVTKRIKESNIVATAQTTSAFASVSQAIKKTEKQLQ